jgi:DNA-binding NarL/FixJ family response regulator
VTISGPARILIGDNQVVYRAGIAEVLSGLNGIAIVARCSDWSQLFEAISRNQHATVIAASTLRPDWSRLMELISCAQSRLIVVAENVESYAEFTAQGASGVIFRDSTLRVLRNCVRHVAAGKRYGTPAIITPDQEDIVGSNVRNRLTPKELRILSLLVQGCRNREIATRLNTTEQVIKNYLRAVFDKAGVSDRYELALFTIHHRALATRVSIISAELETRSYGSTRLGQYFQLVKTD